MHSAATPLNFHLPPLATLHKSACGQSRRIPPFLRQPEKPKIHSTADEATLQSGLRTPPADDMGTTYQIPNLGSCVNHHAHHHAPYVSTLASNDRTRKAFNDGVYESPSRYAMPSQQQESFAQSRAGHAASASISSTSRHSTRPSTPQSGPMTAAEQATATRDATMVLHSLQIPTCISPRGGNLADFAAQVTCLFWFESIKTLEAAESFRALGPTGTVRRLTENAIPIPNFKKWVQTVLSTTQVTQNVILLALLFIYRLKVANPNVKGRPGSEYRLLTVALMLGNKFLDDNTYTNKTWAEVSGISVGEIHVMEVEFLSNMRYSLLVSKGQWEEWLVKLAKFWEYCDRAQRPPISPLVIPSPTQRSNFASPLPSPTGIHSQPIPSLHPGQGTPQTAASQAWQAAYQAGNVISPLALKPEPYNTRKRSLAEEDPTEPPAKRISRQPLKPQPQPYSQRGVSTAAAESARLPVPSLAINTSNTAPQPPAITHPVSNGYAPQQASALSLPPLVPGVRAMSTVYTPTAVPLASQVPLSSTSGPHVSTSAAPIMTPTTTYQPPAYGTPTKRLSPQSSLTPATASYASSPMTESFQHHAMTPLGSLGTGSGMHTPMSHSPSIYLQQRPSPYKPVRHVNTLLYPPPSAFLHEYHLSNAVPPAQMHYQPLGRRNEYRTGIVPEFAVSGSGLYPNGRHGCLTPAPAQAIQHMAQSQANHAQAQARAQIQAQAQAQAQAQQNQFAPTVGRSQFGPNY